MKKLAIISLIAIVLLQSGIKMGIIAYYQINKAYIVANLCENKEKPKMACNGHCYLAKKIKAQEEGEQNLPSILKGMEDFVLYCSSFDFSITNLNQLLSNVLNPGYLVKRYTSLLVQIFLPPKL